MQAKELINIALAHMAEPPSSSTDYSAYAVPMINVLLAECFVLNNSLRVNDGLDALEAVPYVNGTDDDIPYDTKLMYSCLSYGLAAKLILEDNDIAKFNYFNGMYVQGMQNNTSADNGKIFDYYGDQSSSTEEGTA